MTIIKEKELVYSSEKDRRNILSRSCFYKYKKTGERILLHHHGVYKPIMPQVVKVLFSGEIEEAKSRVRITERGYSYTPSHSYLRALSKTYKLCHYQKLNQQSSLKDLRGGRMPGNP